MPEAISDSSTLIHLAGIRTIERVLYEGSHYAGSLEGGCRIEKRRRVDV